MKKLTSILLVLVLIVPFAACSGKSDSGSETATQSPTVSGSAQPENEAQNDGSNGAVKGKTLVVYYSATGSTKAVAKTVADTVGADLFEITPVDPYTSDDLNWSNDNSRVSVEHNDESKRNVPLTKVTPDNWADYDTVFVGYPIWWGIAAWPVNDFIKGNDFTGKTVIPFCTSASSGIGRSGKLLSDMAGTGKWLDGERFSSSASQSQIDEWINSLGINA